MLRSLEIAGFKSFARPIRLELPVGITAFVGSNGSGKSNVVDAIRWCLGEQSVRDLRAQRSEDVIYAGPRRTLGAAEVALTFDELSPSEWDEVSIARRLYRSGESEYLVNGRKTRLMDLLDVARLIGIGADRHIIVTQGMADSLLSASPVERRALIEQAAGLAGYRSRRDEARQKLEVTSGNVATLEIVLAELEPRLRLLRRQARALEERDEAARKLTDSLLQWYGAKWKAADMSRTKACERVRALGHEREVAIRELAELEGEAETSLEREREWHAKLETGISALHMVQRERDGLDHQLRYLESRSSDVEGVLERLKAVIEASSAQQSAVKERAEVARRDLEQSNLAIAGHEKVLADIVAQMSEAQAAVAEADDSVGRARTVCAALEQRVAQAVGERQSVLAAMEQYRTQIEEQERRRIALREALDRASIAVGQARQQAADAEDIENRLQERAERASRDVSRARDRSDHLDRIFRRAGILQSHCTAEVQQTQRELSRLETALSGGIVSSLEVAAGWEEALAAGLGEWARTRMDSLRVVDEVDEELRDKWRSQFARTVGRPLRWADREVKGYPRGRSNPLAMTLLADSDSDAAALWKEVRNLDGPPIGLPPVQVVSRDGSSWTGVGIRRHGGKGEAPAQYLRTKNRAAASEGRIAHWVQRINAIEKAREVTAAHASRLVDVLRAVELDVQRAHRVTEEQTLALERAVREELHAREAHARHARDQLRLQSSLEGAEERSKVLEEARGTLELELISSKQVCFRKEKVQSALHDEVLKHGARAEEEKQTLDGMRVQLAVRERTLAIAVSENADSASRHASSLAERQRSLSELRRIAEDVEANQVRARQLDLEVGQRNQRLTEIRSEAPIATAPVADLRERRTRTTVAIAEHERAMAALSHCESQTRELKAEVWRELAMAPDALPTEVQSPPSDDEVRRLRTRVMQYAAAEPSVVAEYEELAKRQEHLKEEVQDLQVSAEDLRRTIDLTDSEMKLRFTEAFREISEQFAVMFQTMLSGGEARLEQIDDDGAIDVRARLPGRRSRSSSSFSGGERSLVASALLFGVLSYRPTPFCVLDEVDAALDESNVDRYLAVLTEMSRRIQMIVVTHNRATMAAADVLYGLTMDQEGISNVLSLRLDAYDVGSR